jgi:hypothetical protein
MEVDSLARSTGVLARSLGAVSSESRTWWVSPVADVATSARPMLTA